MFKEIAQTARTILRWRHLPKAARAECRRDRLGLPTDDPGIERAVNESIGWLSRAQDHSSSRDGGVASHFSLVHGWSASYPETTGYIVPTMLAYAALREDGTVRQRVRRMADWLVSIQFPDGSFQGGQIGAKPVVPVAFNTGQILLGLASAAREFGPPYRQAMRRAADWLVQTQDPDGCWRKHPTPFARPGEKAYDTHAAWGLLEAARVDPDGPYVQSALANVRWALGLQEDNGWFAGCCLTDPPSPLTHTLGYALRGIIEAYRFTYDKDLLRACRTTADGLLTALHNDGFLPGRLYPNWSAAVPWACLTGSAQIGCCWFILYESTGDLRYRDAAYAVNRYLRRTMQVNGPPETRGAIKGSFPVYGGYSTYQYLSWACKFFIDSSLLELTVRRDDICF